MATYGLSWVVYEICFQNLRDLDIDLSRSQGQMWRCHWTLLSLITKSRFWKGRCTEWSQNDIEHYTDKGTPCVYFSGRESQISLRFTLLSLVSQIMEVLGFPTGNNAEFKNLETKIVKTWKLKISKKPKVVLWWSVGEKFRTSLKTFGCDV